MRVQKKPIEIASKEILSWMLFVVTFQFFSVVFITWFESFEHKKRAVLCSLFVPFGTLTNSFIDLIFLIFILSWAVPFLLQIFLLSPFQFFFEESFKAVEVQFSFNLFWQDFKLNIHHGSEWDSVWGNLQWDHFIFEKKREENEHHAMYVMMFLYPLLRLEKTSYPLMVEFMLQKKNGNPFWIERTTLKCECLNESRAWLNPRNWRKELSICNCVSLNEFNRRWMVSALSICGITVPQHRIPVNWS